MNSGKWRILITAFRRIVEWGVVVVVVVVVVVIMSVNVERAKTGALLQFIPGVFSSSPIILTKDCVSLRWDLG